MQRRLFIEVRKKPGAYLNMVRGKEHSSMEVDDASLWVDKRRDNYQLRNEHKNMI